PEQPPVEANPPAAEEPAQAAPPIEPQVNESQQAARVTALDFNANSDGGTVVIKTNYPVQYTTRKNDKTNQFIVELSNTTVPKKLQRPYNTKEFSSPIASINA